MAHVIQGDVGAVILVPAVTFSAGARIGPLPPAGSGLGAAAANYWWWFGPGAVGPPEMVTVLFPAVQAMAAEENDER
jgi:hypothetical protein